MIKLENVSKSYPLQGFARYTVFRGINLEIPARTHVGLVGRNGAGKSTLLRLIGGMELPERGRITAEGSVSPPLGLASGFAQQLSGRDNARFVCRINGDDNAAVRERTAFIGAFSELGDFFDRPVITYSSGMRARLAFSISMSFSHDYYLIDELTAVGDQKFRKKAEASFADKRGQASIIMASHNLQQLQRDCEVGIYMKAGEALFFDDIGDALEAYRKDQTTA